MCERASVNVEHAGRFLDNGPRVERDDVCVFVSQTGDDEVSE